MSQTQGSFILSLTFLAFLLAPPQNIFCAPLPKSTQKILKKLNLTPSILANIDKELEVPRTWIEKAKQEGMLRIRGTSGDALVSKHYLAPFKERYPFLKKVDFTGHNNRGRTIKTLVSYRAGRIIADVVMSVGAATYAFKAADALEDHSDIPGMKNVPDRVRKILKSGTVAPTHRSYWCLGYNTRSVKKADIPKRWEDILTNPRWRNGNLAIPNRPAQWVIHIWKAKGASWTKGFLTKLFTEVKPQLRKEGTNALPGLLAAGEFDMAIPVSNNSIYRAATFDGAPVGFACPEPVPTGLGDMAILKGAPNLYAAKIFVNWLLSKEGQISRFAYKYNPPVHKDLQRKEFVLYSEEILGKKMSFREPRDLLEIGPTLDKFWNNLWLRGRKG